MPIIHLEKCIQCLKCVNDCPSNAIDIEKGTIDKSCIHCGHCVAICPESTIAPDLGTIKPLEKSRITSEGFRNLSSGIRSCRSYLKKEVSEASIQALIENIKHYPSASNTRPVLITVVQTPENVQKLNDQTTDSLIKTLKLVTNPIIMPIVKVLAPSLKVNSLKKYKDQFIARQKSNTSQVCHHAPVVLLFHGPASKLGMAKTDADIWATYTSIYANTMGFGTCFIGFIVKAMESNKAMRKEFNIPAGHQVYTALTLGYPKYKYINETSRTEPEFELL